MSAAFRASAENRSRFPPREVLTGGPREGSHAMPSREGRLYGLKADTLAGADDEDVGHVLPHSRELQQDPMMYGRAMRSLDRVSVRADKMNGTCIGRETHTSAWFRNQPAVAATSQVGSDPVGANPSHRRCTVLDLLPSAG